MSSFIHVPMQRLAPEVLDNLLQEYASRDGTDYGEVELTLAEKTGNLRRQLEQGDISILYDLETEQWDLVNAEQAQRLLQDQP